jgi:hypothetical protein
MGFNGACNRRQGGTPDLDLPWYFHGCFKTKNQKPMIFAMEWA